LNASLPQPIDPSRTAIDLCPIVPDIIQYKHDFLYVPGALFALPSDFERNVHHQIVVVLPFERSTVAGFHGNIKDFYVDGTGEVLEADTGRTPGSGASGVAGEG
jgi:hypothetical protein